MHMYTPPKAFSPPEMLKEERWLALAVGGVLIASVLSAFACLVYARIALGHWPHYLPDPPPSTVLSGWGYNVHLLLNLLQVPCLLFWVAMMGLSAWEHKALRHRAALLLGVTAVAGYFALSYLPGTCFEWLFLR